MGSVEGKCAVQSLTHIHTSLVDSKPLVTLLLILWTLWPFYYAAAPNYTPMCQTGNFQPVSRSASVFGSQWLFVGTVAHTQIQGHPTSTGASFERGAYSGRTCSHFNVQKLCSVFTLGMH